MGFFWPKAVLVSAALSGTFWGIPALAQQLQNPFPPIAPTPAYVQQQAQAQSELIRQQTAQVQWWAQQQQQNMALGMSAGRLPSAPQAQLPMNEYSYTIPPNVTCNAFEELTHICYYKSLNGWSKLQHDQNVAQYQALKAHYDALMTYRSTITDPKDLALFDVNPDGYIAAQDQKRAASSLVNGQQR